MPDPAVIFDFGNVIAFFDFTRACAPFAPSLGLDAAGMLERLRVNGLGELLREYESGSITSAEFSKKTRGMTGLDLEHDAFEAAWGGIFWPNESIVPVVRALKARGVTLVLGSNTNEMHAVAFRRQFADVLDMFDHVVLSYEVGHLKPAPEFYLACVAAVRRPVDECVFIDDLRENVDGAVRTGLRGIYYRDTPALVADLKALGIDPDG